MNKVIAIDFDDVCAETFAAMVRVINAKFGKTFSVDDIVTSWLFHTPGWGGPTNVRRLQELDGLWVTHDAYDLQPVAGLRRALFALAKRRWAIYIVTARPPPQQWYVAQFFAVMGVHVGPQEVIKEIVMTGKHHLAGPDAAGGQADTGGPGGLADMTFTPFPQTTEEVLVEMERDVGTLGDYVRGWRGAAQGRLKLETVQRLGASVFIDDNPVFCDEVAKDPTVRAICFGPHQWSDRVGSFEHPHSLLTGDEREARGVPLPFPPTPVRDNLVRAKSWPETLALIESWERE